MSDTTSTEPDQPTRLEAGLTDLRERPVLLNSNLVTPNRSVLFDAETCIRCNLCIEACSMDVLAPNPVDGGLPLIIFPDECWYCGCCEIHCPKYEEGAIRINFPLMQRGRWKRRESGEHFRVGMKDPPPPNTRKPA